MADNQSLEGVAIDELYTLLALISLERSGATPAHAPAVEDTCIELPDPDAEFVGRLSEAEVSRMLYALEEQGLVQTVEDGDSSPTGKGRPRYELAVDPAAVLEAGDQRENLMKATDAVRDA